MRTVRERQCKALATQGRWNAQPITRPRRKEDRKSRRTLIASTPLTRSFCSWSRMIMKGRPYSSKTIDMLAAAVGCVRRCCRSVQGLLAPALLPVLLLACCGVGSLLPDHRARQDFVWPFAVRGVVARSTWFRYGAVYMDFALLIHEKSADRVARIYNMEDTYCSIKIENQIERMVLYCRDLERKQANPSSETA